jgi:uncharacterized protein (DUF885 family)
MSMKTIRSFHLALFAALLAISPHLQAQPRDIEQFFDEFTAEWVRHNPDLATALRYFSGPEQDALERELTPNTRAWQLERIALARRGLEELAKYDLSKVSEAQRLSALIMRWQLDSVVRSEPHLDILFPLDQFNGANVDLVESLTLYHPLATRRDAENYLARLEQVDERMDEALAEGRRLLAKGVIPPRFIIERTLTQLRDFRSLEPKMSPLVVAYGQRLASIESIPQAERSKLEASAARLVEAEVYPAWDRAIALMEEALPKSNNDAGLWRLEGGAEAYRYFLNRFTTTELGPEEIHEIGLKQVAAIEAQMDAILRKLGRTQGSVKERIEQLKKDLAYPNPTSEESRAAIMRDIDRYIEEAWNGSKTLFDLQPKTPVIARPFPRFREASAAANYNRAPLDRSRPAIFQMPLRPERMTKFGLRTLVYHETVPGHHFQIAIEQENTELPRFRQARALGGISAMSEGWALYAEKLVAEEGWYEGDPEGLLGQLDAQLFRAKRLVVDTGLHAKRWTRQQAIDYGLEPSEVERYVVLPGQACAYMIGQLRLLELRDKARRELGDKFSPKEFHNVVLKTGTAPLSIIEGEVARYLKQKKRGQ